MTVTETAIMDENGNQIGTRYKPGYKVENLDSDGEPQEDGLELLSAMGDTDPGAKRPQEFDGLSKDSDQYTPDHNMPPAA